MDFQPEDEAVGEDDIYRIKAAKTKEKWQFIVSVLSNIKEDENAVQLLRAKCVEEEWLINAFFKLGREVIEQQKYSKTTIKSCWNRPSRKKLCNKDSVQSFCLT
ncbi:hypothetical protein KUBF_48900 [Bacteroides finegoldii]|nr:hypothetical protein KUBF_48900 [Bacteroides finegoldii]